MSLQQVLKHVYPIEVIRGQKDYLNETSTDPQTIEGKSAVGDQQQGFLAMAAHQYNV